MEPGTVLLALLGLLLLGVSADALVRGAVGIAGWFGLSPLFTGLVLVGAGTSMPELVTTMVANLRGSAGIAVGNVVGSNIANILLILGLSALIMPIPADPASFRRDAPMMAIATVVCVLVIETGNVSRLGGFLFVLLLVLYLVYTYRAERLRPDASAAIHEQEGKLLMPTTRRAAVSVLLAVGGLIGIISGADLLVRASIRIAAAAGIPETVIGLTVVAVGTSLPELATSVAAAIRRQMDIALGNIIGSNIFNALGILGLAALVRPIRMPEDVARIDAWVLLGTTGLLLYYALTEARISRSEAVVFLGLYAGYLLLVGIRIA